MNDIFKFGIGEEVKTKNNCDVEATKLKVVMSLIERCPGGERLLYRCRKFEEGNVGSDTIQFNENELEAVNPVESVDSKKDVNINGVFEFNLSDFVMTKTSLNLEINVFEVVSCFSDKCIGINGKEIEQFHYNCRAYIFDGGVSIQTITFNEAELVACNIEEELEKREELKLEQKLRRKNRFKEMEKEYEKRQSEKKDDGGNQET